MTSAPDGRNAPAGTRAGARKGGLARGPEPVRALVLHPYLRSESAASGRGPDDRLAEAVGLARAIDLDVIDARLVPLATRAPATLLGSGKVEEIGGQVAAQEIGLVIVDAALSPVQQRNLEKAWDAKVIDRTGLILEIFGERARTREGTLQVELAHLLYQKSRLVRSWTHLERQRGGLGFIGGPGETQIETDRRLIGERIVRIRRQLETVTRTRKLHRAERRKVPYPIVALVGYTNAGKSTLFNRLTAGGVLAKDMLFATLDPTMRAADLPSGRRVILSDTVGFISDLPTALVAAFRATLEEVLEADVLLHARDVASPESGAQARDVDGVLGELGIGLDDVRPRIEVLNKADLLPADEHDALARRLETPGRGPRQILISAETGEGLPRLLGALDEALSGSRTVLDLDLDAGDGALLAWLHSNAEITERHDTGDGHIHVRIGIDGPALGRLRKRLGTARITGLAAD